MHLAIIPSILSSDNLHFALDTQNEDVLHLKYQWRLWKELINVCYHMGYGINNSMIK